MNRILLIGVLLIAGCTGMTARQKALRPAIENGWASLRAYAVDPNAMDAAIVDCGCPELDDAWDETEVVPTGSEALKAEKQETVNLLDTAIPLYCEEEL